MITSAIDSAALHYATGWDHAIMPRVVIGLAGLAILALSGRATRKKDYNLLGVLLWLAMGLAFLVFSIIPQEVIRFVISTDYLTRIRVIMGGLSVLVLLVTVESIRRTHLQEKYALLWVATALVILVCVFFPDTVALFRAVTGMEYATAIISVTFTFLVMVAFHFSISMSAMQSKQSKIAQRVAILEARIKELEEKSAGKSSKP